MSYAESLVQKIDERIAAVRAATSQPGGESRTNARPDPGEWSANEVLLHLVGDTADLAVSVQSSLRSEGFVVERPQRGGEYIARPQVNFQELASLLESQLVELKSVIQGLPDDDLSRTVQIPGYGQAAIGLWLRSALGEHFEDHLRQMLGALAPVSSAR